MPPQDLRKSLFLSAKVLDLRRALDTYEASKRAHGMTRPCVPVSLGGVCVCGVSLSLCVSVDRWGCPSPPPPQTVSCSPRPRRFDFLLTNKHQEMKRRGRALARDERNTLLYVCQVGPNNKPFFWVNACVRAYRVYMPTYLSPYHRGFLDACLRYVPSFVRIVSIHAHISHHTTTTTTTGGHIDISPLPPPRSHNNHNHDRRRPAAGPRRRCGYTTS